MSSNAPTFVDTLAPLASPEVQRLAAKMAQEVFAGAFRQSVEADSADSETVLAEVGQRCFNWCQAGEAEDARALRVALLIAGLDQWGLAYSQAFGLQAIPALSAVIGGLRTRLDPKADARFQWFFSQIADVEADAIDFKIELRRSIHVALWHAMAACETSAQAEPILQCLGGLMVALNERMPELGWRLLADALASIQIGLLSGESVSDVAQEGTQQLFEALRRALPLEKYQSILAFSGQAVVAWQRQRAG